jgi:hypothetical protein
MPFILTHLISVISAFIAGYLAALAEVNLIKHLSEDQSSYELVYSAVYFKLSSIFILITINTLGHYFYSCFLTLGRLVAIENSVEILVHRGQSGQIAKEFLVDTERVSNQFFFLTSEFAYSVGVVVVFLPYLLMDPVYVQSIENTDLILASTFLVALIFVTKLIIKKLSSLSNKSNEALNLFPEMLRSVVSYMWSFKLSHLEFKTLIMEKVKPRILLAEASYNLNNAPRYLIELGIIITVIFSIDSKQAIISSVILLRILPHFLAFLRFSISTASIWYSVKRVYVGN